LSEGLPPHGSAPGGAPLRIEVGYRSPGFLRLDLPRDPGGEPALVVGVHGYGQPLEPFAEWLLSVAPPSAAVAVPEGPERFHRDPRRPRSSPTSNAWITTRDREPFDRRNDAFLRAALDAVREHVDAPPARTALVGFSQGAGVATHFALTSRDGVGALVGLAGGLAAVYRPRLGALSGLPVLWVSGTRDEAYPPAYVGEWLAALRAGGVDLEALELEAEHDLLGDAREAVRSYLAGRLVPSR